MENAYEAHTARPAIKPKMKSTFHRDGTVSFWNVYTQQWERKPAAGIGDLVLESLSDAERARIKTMAAWVAEELGLSENGHNVAEDDEVIIGYECLGCGHTQATDGWGGRCDRCNGLSLEAMYY